MSALIDGLWRKILLQTDEENIAAPDRDKGNPESETFDPLYQYTPNLFVDPDEENRKHSYQRASGFANKIFADFASSNGYGNEVRSYFATVSGPYAPIPENPYPKEWNDADLLHVFANGQNAQQRAYALYIYKSGFADLNNALRIGAYNHPVPKVPGIIEYTEEAGFTGYHNGQSIPFHPELDSFFKTGEIELTPGLQTVEFPKPFTGPYTVMVEGRLPTELVICRVINTDDLAFFTVNVRKACLLVWQAIKK